MRGRAIFGRLAYLIVVLAFTFAVMVDGQVIICAHSSSISCMPSSDNPAITFDVCGCGQPSYTVTPIGLTATMQIGTDPFFTPGSVAEFHQLPAELIGMAETDRVDRPPES
jgi:hypothetical protein